ncbi:MAG: acyl-[acyl-carrier-protein]--UDP-N-acetylglucosamine O-acyltransferase [Zetaproteobacteria bacterium]|nr:MAG: acyl-[acyl-carrier-protein]--UDP-N-acetylglucosamine O-acyltransferase [Zetaproteobacteria bacterium]
MTRIHPTAIIEDGAVIGDDVDVGPYAVIFRHATIGPHCRIHTGAVIGDVPQDLAFKNVDSVVRIGAGCVIREHVTIHRGTKEGTGTVVGDGCYLMAHSHLGHNVQLGRRVILANALLAGYVEIGDLAFISGNACVHQFVRIGRLAMLGGLAAATKDVPPFCTMRPTALNAVTALNVIGMRRAGMTPTERAEAKEAFRLLYRASLNVTQALEAIRGNFQGGPAIEMCDFIAASKRGICRLDDSADDDQAPDPD